jgi:hypothetical protein
MATLQVKGIDSRLYETLRRRAQLDSRSISQEVILIIQEYLSGTSRQFKNSTQEFLKLSGAWAGSESAKEIIDYIRASRKRTLRRTLTHHVFD